MRANILIINPKKYGVANTMEFPQGGSPTGNNPLEWGNQGWASNLLWQEFLENLSDWTPMEKEEDLGAG